MTKVIRITVIGKSGNLRAYADIEIDGIKINSCKIMEGEKGLWLAFPSVPYENKAGEKKYQPIVEIPDKDFYWEIKTAVIDSYNGKDERKPSDGTGKKVFAPDPPEDDIPF